MTKQSLTIKVFYELKLTPEQPDHLQSRFTFKTGYSEKPFSSHMFGVAPSFDAMINSIHKHDDMARFNLDVIQVSNLESISSDLTRSPSCDNINEAEFGNADETATEKNKFLREMSEKHGVNPQLFSQVKKSLIIDRIMIPAKLVEAQVG